MIVSGSVLQPPHQSGLKISAAFLSRMYQMFREGQEQLQSNIDRSLADLKRDLVASRSEAIGSASDIVVHSIVYDQTTKLIYDDPIVSSQNNLPDSNNDTAPDCDESGDAISVDFSRGSMLCFTPFALLSPEVTMKHAAWPTWKSQTSRNPYLVQLALLYISKTFPSIMMSDMRLMDRWKPRQVDLAWYWTVFFAT